MEQIVITRRDGSTFALRNKGDGRFIMQAVQSVEFQSNDTVKITVESLLPITFEIGDTITIFGKLYRLNLTPTSKKTSDHRFHYELTFEGVQYDLLRVSYDVNLDTTGSDLVGDSLTANLFRFMQVLVANANRVFPGKWALGVCPDGETKTLTFADMDMCLTVLQNLCSDYKVEFEIVQNAGVYTINIKTAVGSVFPTTFAFGKGKGLYELTRQKTSTSNIVTRLKVYGGTKNVPTDYRCTKICLPGKTKSQSYIEDPAIIAQFGVWEGVKNFEEIFPDRKGNVGSIVAENILQFSDATMFDLNELKEDGITTKYLLPGIAAKVHFNTGDLAGYEFDVHAYDHETHTFTIRQFTDDRGQKFPAAGAFQIGVGDEYAINNINLPDEYITTAESDVQTEGLEFYSQNSQPKVQYGLLIYQGFLAELFGEVNIQSNIFWPGDYIPVVDSDLQVNKSLRIKSMTRNLLKDDDFTLTISDIAYQQSTINRVLSETVEVNKVIRINDLTDVAKARRNWMATQEALNMVFDPEGDYYTGKIKPESIETIALSAGAKSMQFVLRNTLFEANYGGDRNVIKMTGGVLSHYTIETAIRSWILNTTLVSALEDTKAYYIYAKCEINIPNEDPQAPPVPSDAGLLILSEAQIKVKEVANYYHFLIGDLSSVIDGARIISLTYGSTTINGKFIRTGEISSSDGTCKINLDGNELILGDATSELSWNKGGNKRVKVKGLMVVSQGGSESPLGAFLGPWYAGIICYAGDTVTYAGSTWRYIFATPSDANTPAPSEGQYWTCVGAAGENGIDGAGVEFIFTRNNTGATPTTPTGDPAIDDYVPAGWTDNQQGVTPLYPYEFVSKRTGSTGNWGAFSTPKLWAKYSWDGDDGLDGAGVEFIFTRNNTGATPTTPTGDPAIDDYVPAGWTDTMSGVTETMQYEFASKRTGSTGSWGAFSTPKLWSKFGENGIDGESIEFIFTRNNTGATPATPATAQQDDYVPSGWYDNMQGVTSVYPFEFVSMRTKTAGVWSVFSTPRLWSRYSYDGDDAPVTERRYAKNGSLTTGPALTDNTALAPAGWTLSVPSVGALEFLWVIECQKTPDKTAMVGTWSNPARLTGAVGQTGAPGPLPMGGKAYDNSKSYYGNAVRVDIVIHASGKYVARVDCPVSPFSGVEPSVTTGWQNYWNVFTGDYDLLATGLLFAQLAYIENLGVNYLRTGVSPNARIAINRATNAAGSPITPTNAIEVFEDGQSDDAIPVIKIDDTAGYDELGLGSYPGIEVRKDTVAKISSIGVFANGPGMQVFSSAYGITAKALITALASGNVSDANGFLAGLYATASNTGSAPTYAAYLDGRTKIGGLLSPVQGIELSEVVLTESDPASFYLDKSHFHVTHFATTGTRYIYLPSSTNRYYGQMFWIVRINTLSLIVKGNGVTIFKGTSEYSEVSISEARNTLVLFFSKDGRWIANEISR